MPTLCSANLAAQRSIAPKTIRTRAYAQQHLAAQRSCANTQYTTLTCLWSAILAPQHSCANTQHNTLTCLWSAILAPQHSCANTQHNTLTCLWSAILAPQHSCANTQHNTTQRSYTIMPVLGATSDTSCYGLLVVRLRYSCTLMTMAWRLPSYAGFAAIHNRRRETSSLLPVTKLARVDDGGACRDSRDPHYTLQL
jgi:hypothetical protein